MGVVFFGGLHFVHVQKVVLASTKENNNLQNEKNTYGRSFEVLS